MIIIMHGSYVMILHFANVRLGLKLRAVANRAPVAHWSFPPGRGGSQDFFFFFFWGGAGKKRCARTHITGAEPNSLLAGVQGPLKGPGSSRVVLMLSRAI